MEVSRSNLPPVTGQALKTAISAWRVGQILHAITLADSQGGKVNLKIGANVVTADTPQPLKEGARLTLRVSSIAQQVTLQVEQPVQVPDTLKSALRRLLPKQTPLKPLFTQLSRLTSVATEIDKQPSLTPRSSAATQATQQTLQNAGSDVSATRPGIADDQAAADLAEVTRASLQSAITKPATQKPIMLQSDRPQATTPEALPTDSYSIRIDAQAKPPATAPAQGPTPATPGEREVSAEQTPHPPLATNTNTSAVNTYRSSLPAQTASQVLAQGATATTSNDAVLKQVLTLLPNREMVATPTGLRAAIDLIIAKVVPLLRPPQTATHPPQPTTDTTKVALPRLLQLLTSTQQQLPAASNSDRALAEHSLLPPPSPGIQQRIDRALSQLPTLQTAPAQTTPATPPTSANPSTSAAPSAPASPLAPANSSAPAGPPAPATLTTPAAGSMPSYPPETSAKAAQARITAVIRQLSDVANDTRVSGADKTVIRRLGHLLEAIQTRLPAGTTQAISASAARATVSPPAASLPPTSAAAATATAAATPGTTILQPAHSTTLPEPILKLARELISHLPDVGKLGTPDGLRKAVQDSGLFLEARLAAQNPASAMALPDNDLKAGLLRLLALLQTQSQQNLQAATPAPQSRDATSPNATLLAPLTDELLKHVEGAVSRLQLNQLQSRTSDTEQRPVWLFDLPVRHEKAIDVIRVRIEQERRHQQTETLSPWRVDLSFDFAELGPVHARISVRGESVSTLFRADNPAAVAHFRDHLNTLQGRLTQLGLSVEQLAVRQGTDPTNASLTPAMQGISALLNEKA